MENKQKKFQELREKAMELSKDYPGFLLVILPEDITFGEIFNALKRLG